MHFKQVSTVFGALWGGVHAFQTSLYGVCNVLGGSLGAFQTGFHGEWFASGRAYMHFKQVSTVFGALWGVRECIPNKSPRCFVRFGGGVHACQPCLHNVWRALGVSVIAFQTRLHIVCALWGWSTCISNTFPRCLVRFGGGVHAFQIRIHNVSCALGVPQMYFKQVSTMIGAL